MILDRDNLCIATHLDWSLAVQCVEHIRTCHAKYPINTKAVVVLLDWSQFKTTTIGPKLLGLRRFPTIDSQMFSKPSPLGKRHTIVIVPWPIIYWVIDKDTSMKVSPTHVESVVSSDFEFCESGLFDTKSPSWEMYPWSKNGCSNCK